MSLYFPALSADSKTNNGPKPEAIDFTKETAVVDSTTKAVVDSTTTAEVDSTATSQLTAALSKVGNVKRLQSNTLGLTTSTRWIDRGTGRRRVEPSLPHALGPPPLLSSPPPHPRLSRLQHGIPGENGIHGVLTFSIFNSTLNRPR